MKITSIQERDGYVEVCFDGEFSTRHVSEIGADLLRASGLKSGHRLIVNFLRVTGGPPSTLERYQLGLLAADLPQSVKIAAVAPSSLLDPNRFALKVARNRGAWISVFEDLQQAISWLQSAEDNPPPANPS